mgnify:CR=1 FL=1
MPQSTQTFCTAGSAMRSHSEAIRSATSSSWPMRVWLPRPIAAALRMNQALGAEPIETVNSRLVPSRSPTCSSSSRSLPTLPSVTNTICRSSPSWVGSAIARSSAGRMLVPPSASRSAMKSTACSWYQGRAGMDSSNRARVSELNSSTLKRSSGSRNASPCANAARACSIEVPSIEPEVSTTNTTSRGRGSMASGAGGASINRA